MPRYVKWTGPRCCKTPHLHAKTQYLRGVGALNNLRGVCSYPLSLTSFEHKPYFQENGGRSYLVKLLREYYICPYCHETLFYMK